MRYPRCAGQGCTLGRRRLHHFPPHHPADVHAHHHGLPDLQFTQIWNDLLFGVVFSSGDSQPITVALNNPAAGTSTGAKEYNVDMAAAMIAGLPTLLVYVVAGKYFVRGLTAGAVKG